jgi:prevent-host-death family protein
MASRKARKTKTVAAEYFEMHCRALIDWVQATGRLVVVTKRGKPIAKLVPVKQQPDDIFGFMVGKVRIVGDVMSPVLSSDP